MKIFPEGITLTFILPSGPAGIITTCSARNEPCIVCVGLYCTYAQNTCVLVTLGGDQRR